MFLLWSQLKEPQDSLGAFFFGKIFFNENITKQKVLGVVLITTGVFLLV